MIEDSLVKIENCPITFSESAFNELKRIRTEQATDKNQYLRIGIKGGGCAGFNYLLAFDNTELNDKDQLIKNDTFNIVIDQSHLLYLVGMVVDYEKGLNNRGFVFRNPNAKETCGCGTSFSV